MADESASDCRHNGRALIRPRFSHSFSFWYKVENLPPLLLPRQFHSPPLDTMQSRLMSASRRLMPAGRRWASSTPSIRRWTSLRSPIASVPQRRTFASTRLVYSPDVFPSQLEDPASAEIFSSLQSSKAVPQTLTEKIVQKYAVGLPQGKFVQAGDYVTISPHRCMTHDNSWPVALKFMSIGATKLHNPDQIVMTLDHDVQNKSEKNLQKYRQIEEFAKHHGVEFYPAGRGIGHQIMVEEGFAWPGTLVVASDSHSNMYGGIGCLGAYSCGCYSGSVH